MTVDCKDSTIACVLMHLVIIQNHLQWFRSPDARVLSRGFWLGSTSRCNHKFFFADSRSVSAWLELRGLTESIDRAEQSRRGRWNTWLHPVMLFLKSSSLKGISSLSERTISHSGPAGLSQGAFSHISHCGPEQHSCDVFKNKVEKQIGQDFCGKGTLVINSVCLWWFASVSRS